MMLELIPHVLALPPEQKSILAKELLQQVALESTGWKPVATHWQDASVT